MKRPVLLVVAVAVALAAVAVIVFVSPGAAPVSLSRSDVTVRLDRAGTGNVNAEVEVPTRTTAVSVFATMPQMGHMTPEITAAQEKPGLFRVTGELFPMAGLWELTVHADGEVVTFEIMVK